MRYKISSIIFLLLVLTPVIAPAEHDCIDERPYGHQIKVKEKLPKKWLMIGDKSIMDPQLHSILRTKYAKYYTSGVDGEGFTIDHFCGYKNGIYIDISNGDFGPSAEFSQEAPKCEKCSPVTEEIKTLVSASGLKIGQNQATVSSILGYTIKDDIMSILFEEIEKDNENKIWHSQRLRVEFRNDRLIRFSVSDYRERYN
jgi:hypothetical protein